MSDEHWLLRCSHKSKTESKCVLSQLVMLSEKKLMQYLMNRYQKYDAWHFYNGMKFQYFLWLCNQMYTYWYVYVFPICKRRCHRTNKYTNLIIHMFAIPLHMYLTYNCNNQSAWWMNILASESIISWLSTHFDSVLPFSCLHEQIHIHTQSATQNNVVQPYEREFAISIHQFFDPVWLGKYIHI